MAALSFSSWFARAPQISAGTLSCKMPEEIGVSVHRGRLPGVGPKVADCIALFALKQHGAVPVDARKLFEFCASFELVKRRWFAT